MLRLCLGTQVVPNLHDARARWKLRRRQPPHLGYELRPLAPQARDVERRRVDGFRELRRAALETFEQLVHRRERARRFEQSFLLQNLRALRNQVPAEAAEIRERRQHPDGRRAKRENAHELDAVTGRAAQQEVLAELAIACVHHVHFADALDQELQGCVDEAAIDPPPPHADGQHHAGRLAHEARGERGDRAHRALR